MKRKNYEKPLIEWHNPTAPLICSGITGSAHGQESDGPWGAKDRSGFGFYDEENDILDDIDVDVDVDCDDDVF